MEQLLLTMSARMSIMIYMMKLATMTYPDGSEITFEVVYHKGSWIGGRLPGEKRVDEYPAEHCRVWIAEWSAETN